MNPKYTDNIKRVAASILAAIFLDSCTNEYIAYHKDVFGSDIHEEQDVSASARFKVSDIETRDPELVITPDKKSLDDLVSEIDNAKNRVYLTVYILTEKRIIKALKDAKVRGVDVKVILERNVYGAGNMNRKSFDSLTSSGVVARYADNLNYRYTHAKYFIIDDAYIISSGNMSYSTFAYNKDFILYGNSEKDLRILEKVFDSDLRGERLIECNGSLVISPTCPRNQFVRSLASATRYIYIYAETFDDEEVIRLLSEKAKSGVDVRVILGDPKKVSSNKMVADTFSKNGIKVIAPKKPYIHAKSFIIDDDIIYIGSINFSNNSIENNREIGMIFRNVDIVGKMKTEFLTNFGN